MRERCWFIPEQVLKGKLPYRDSATFYGPPKGSPRNGPPDSPTGSSFSAPCFVLPGAGTPPSLPGARFLPRSFLVSLGVTAYAWTGRLACALCSIYLLIRGRQSTRFTFPRRYRSGGLARSRPELPMSGTNQIRPASSARMHQTKWCDLDLRFAARTEPTCSAVAGKMEAKVTASGAGLLACF